MRLSLGLSAEIKVTDTAFIRKVTFNLILLLFLNICHGFNGKQDSMSFNSVGNRDYKIDFFSRIYHSYHYRPNLTPVTRHLDLLLRYNIYVINPFKYSFS